jgi:hypothetical protein
MGGGLGAELLLSLLATCSHNMDEPVAAPIIGVAGQPKEVARRARK